MHQEKVFEILVIDDEPPISDVLSRVAQTLFPEANFINTASAKETIDHLDQQIDNLPQLVLRDIDLKQEKNGLDLLPELRERFNRQIPVIMLSALTDETKVQQAYNDGAVAYTQKPDDLAGW